LFGFLAGIAQQKGFFSLDDTASTYLGTGWTSCTAAQEAKILVRHLLSMTSGLKDNVPDPNCQLPSCLHYQADAGTRWAYHNAPYTLSHNILENATGQTLQQFTSQNLLLKTGMFGIWFTDAQTNEVFASRVRDMARFGLLIQNEGIWAGDTLLADTAYFNQMINSSQQLNKSYGYLWWLNGKQSFMVPQSQVVVPGYLIPNAPADAWCALGKNDQKLYVSKSTGLVVVRLGNDAGNPGLAPTIFDNLLWAELNKVICSPFAVVEQKPATNAQLWPIDGQDELVLQTEERVHLNLFSANGQLIFQGDFEAGTHHIAVPKGFFIAALVSNQSTQMCKLMVR
jgi:CubicO group peptidase (beta-lactamase class C family)